MTSKTRRKQWPLAAALVLLGLAGCFKNPTDPNVGTTGGGTSGLPVNNGDTVTTAITAAAVQANSSGIYISTVNQNGTALTANYFSNMSFQVTYQTQSVASGSLTIRTATSTGQNIATSLVLDYSGSMSSTSITDMETAATTFVNNMQTADRGEIIKFADTPVVEQAYTSDKDALRTAITRATAIAGGVTAFWDATDQGVIDTTPESGLRAVVAFTDGYENNSIRVTSQAQLISNARAAGVPIFTVGLGSVDTVGLETIASQTGGHFYFAPTSSQLAAIYQQISQAFSNTIIISWPSFTYTPGAAVSVTVTYVCANGTFTSTATITLP